MFFTCGTGGNQCVQFPYWQFSIELLEVQVNSCLKGNPRERCGKPTFTAKLDAKVSFQLWGFTGVCRKVSLAWVRCCHSFLWPLMGKLIRVYHAKLGSDGWWAVMGDGWSALGSSGSSWEFTIAVDLQPLYLKIPPGFHSAVLLSFKIVSYSHPQGGSHQLLCLLSF